MTIAMPKRRVRESAPIQVYLDASEQRRLDRLAEQLGVSKSAILRRGLLALERDVLDPDNHPALRLIGLASSATPDDPALDPAREHDRILTDAEEASWRSASPRKAPRRGR